MLGKTLLLPACVRLGRLLCDSSLHCLCSPPASCSGALFLQAYADYQEIMDLVEALIQAAAQAVTGSAQVSLLCQRQCAVLRQAAQHQLAAARQGLQTPVSCHLPCDRGKLRQARCMRRCSIRG